MFGLFVSALLNSDSEYTLLEVGKVTTVMACTVKFFEIVGLKGSSRCKKIKEKELQQREIVQIHIVPFILTKMMFVGIAMVIG